MKVGIPVTPTWRAQAMPSSTSRMRRPSSRAARSASASRPTSAAIRTSTSRSPRFSNVVKCPAKSALWYSCCCSSVPCWRANSAACSERWELGVNERPRRNSIPSRSPRSSRWDLDVSCVVCGSACPPLRGNRWVEEEGTPLDVYVPFGLQSLDLDQADIAPRSDEVADHRDLGPLGVGGLGHWALQSGFGLLNHSSRSLAPRLLGPLRADLGCGEAP